MDAATVVDGEFKVSDGRNSSSSNDTLVVAKRYADFWIFSGTSCPVFIQARCKSVVVFVFCDGDAPDDCRIYVVIAKEIK